MQACKESVICIGLALISTQVLASPRLEQLGKCSALLDVAADVYQRDANSDAEDYFRDVSVKLSDLAVAQGLRGTIINDYLYNAHQQSDHDIASRQSRINWLRNNDKQIQRCIDLAEAKVIEN